MTFDPSDISSPQAPTDQRIAEIRTLLDGAPMGWKFNGWWFLNREGSVNAAYARIDTFTKAARAVLERTASAGIGPQAVQGGEASAAHDASLVVDAVLRELAKAARKFPDWPTRGTDAAAIVGEESGELQQAVLQATYEGGDVESVRKEAIQTAAMAIQFLLNLSTTRFDRGEQVPKRVAIPSPEPGQE